MTKQEVIETINKFLVEDFEIAPESLNPEKKIVEELELDSLDTVDIIVRVNEIFGVKLEKEALMEIKTLGEFYDLVYSRLS